MFWGKIISHTANNKHRLQIKIATNTTQLEIKTATNRDQDVCLTRVLDSQSRGPRYKKKHTHTHTQHNTWWLQGGISHPSS